MDYSCKQNKDGSFSIEVEGMWFGNQFQAKYHRDTAYLKARNQEELNQILKQINMETLGQSRIRVQFNPSQDDVVSQVKQKTAELIDLLQSLKTTDGPESDKFLNSGEQLRLISIAQTEYESACMWAVKAATVSK